MMSYVKNELLEVPDKVPQGIDPEMVQLTYGEDAGAWVEYDQSQIALFINGDCVRVEALPEFYQEFPEMRHLPKFSNLNQLLENYRAKFGSYG